MRNTLFCIILATCLSAFANNEMPDYPVKFQVEHYKQDLIAISFQNAKGWHTYFDNPGDAGKPIEMSFSANGKELKVEKLPLPTPYRFIEPGNLIAYGYKDSYVFFYKLPKGINKNSSLDISGNWLVCKHICVPGEGQVKGTLKKALSYPEKFGIQSDLESSYKKIPVKTSLPKNFTMYLSGDIEKKTLYLHYHVKGFTKEIPSNKNLVYPYLKEPFTFKKEQVYKDKDQLYGRFKIEWDGEYMEPERALPIDREFKPHEVLSFSIDLGGKAFVTDVTFERFEKHNKGIDKFYEDLGGAPIATKKSPSTASGTSYLTYLFFAFIGGLILNIMPCVLPVISIKLFGLIEHRNLSRAALLKHNLAYTAGVIMTFMFLGAIVAIMKKTGTNLGWGFQLQSPTFLMVMMIGLVIFALNLFGLFEIRTPFGKSLGGVELRKGFIGDFISGVVATILSTPCSAPFLGTALTFAFTTSYFNIFSMFFMIGLGLSAPFLLTAIIPGAIKILPSPGNWMNTFKKFMGITLLLTVVWLGDIYISIVLPSDDATKEVKAHGLDWEKWSETRMQELKGELVFIDFTAKWCFTCKVNEKLVLETSGFKKLVKDKNLKLLVADWTKRDELIGSFLKKNGKVGVPAYFIQKRDGSLIDLGETITLDEIKSKL